MLTSFTSFMQQRAVRIDREQKGVVKKISTPTNIKRGPRHKLQPHVVRLTVHRWGKKWRAGCGRRRQRRSGKEEAFLNQEKVSFPNSNGSTRKARYAQISSQKSRQGPDYRPATGDYLCRENAAQMDGKSNREKTRQIIWKFLNNC